MDWNQLIESCKKGECGSCSLQVSQCCASYVQIALKSINNQSISEQPSAQSNVETSFFTYRYRYGEESDISILRMLCTQGFKDYMKPIHEHVIKSNMHTQVHITLIGESINTV